MIVVALSLAFPVCLVLVLVGCLNCFNRRKKLQTPRGHIATDGRASTAFSVDIGSIIDPSGPVTIEPLPDILSKVSPAPLLRPVITFSERGKKDAGVPVVSVQRSFPREQLTYLNEVGSGWFGKVIESDATHISGNYKSHVIVKVLKDDASKLEQKRFLDEIQAFRSLEHENVIGLLGQCTDAIPYLAILEFAANGNLKSFLREGSPDLDDLVLKNRLISFALDAASGIACLHKNDFIHNDIAARNCLVMADYTLKIGDYGITDQLFRNEYYSTGSQLLPIRWMAPETLINANSVWAVKSQNKTSDMWSFGVLVWEVCTLGERPYDTLPDEAVLQDVVCDKLVLPSEADIKLPYKDRLWAIMLQCWLEPSDRLDIGEALNSLEQLSRIKLETSDTAVDFDRKWNQLKENQNRSFSNNSDLGSRIALAGSFVTDDSSSLLSSDNEISGANRTDYPISGIDEFADKNDLAVVDVILDLSPQQDKLSMVNELSGTSISPVKVTKPRTPATITQVVEVHSSPAHLDTLDSSLEYITAQEYILHSEHNPTNASVSPNKSSSDNVVEKDGNKIDKQTAEIQGLSDGKHAEANKLNLPDLQAEDDDFSEFVRTSPTAPSTDFTDFATADKELLVHNNVVGTQAAPPEIMSISPETKNSESLNLVEDLFSEFQSASSENLNDVASFTDFSETETFTTAPVTAEVEVDGVNNSDSGNTSKNSSLPTDNLTVGHVSTSGTVNAEVSHIESDLLPLNFNMLAKDKDASNENHTITEKLIADQNQNIFSSDSVLFNDVSFPTIHDELSIIKDLKPENIPDISQKQSEIKGSVLSGQKSTLDQTRTTEETQLQENPSDDKTPLDHDNIQKLASLKENPGGDKASLHHVDSKEASVNKETQGAANESSLQEENLTTAKQVGKEDFRSEVSQ